MTKNEAIQAAHHWQERAEAAEKALADLQGEYSEFLVPFKEKKELLRFLDEEIRKAGKGDK